MKRASSTRDDDEFDDDEFDVEFDDESFTPAVCLSITHAGITRDAECGTRRRSDAHASSSSKASILHPLFRPPPVRYRD